MHAHPRPLIFVNNLWGLVRGSLELLRIRVRNDTSAVRTPHICDSDTLHASYTTRSVEFPSHHLLPDLAERWLIGDTVGGLGRSYGRLCNRYYTDVHVQTSMAGRNTLARHV